MKLSILSTALIISSVAASAPVESISFIKSLSLGMANVKDQLVNLFNPVKNVLKYTMTPPEPETAGIITVRPESMIIDSKQSFLKAIDEAKSKEDLLNVIFHPASLTQLSTLSTVDLLEDATLMGKLDQVLYALMLRTYTLKGRYSRTYIGSAYTDCMTYLYDLVTEDQKQPWPCASASSCTSEAATTLKRDMLAYPACSKVMKVQIDSLASILECKLKSDSDLQKSSTNVREAIRAVLVESHYTNVSVWQAFDSLKEGTAISASNNIDNILGDLSKMTSLANVQSAYASAKAVFNAKTKTIEAASQAADAEIENKIIEAHKEPTSTVTPSKSPTKTEK